MSAPKKLPKSEFWVPLVTEYDTIQKTHQKLKPFWVFGEFLLESRVQWSEARLEKSTPLTTLHGKWLVCHTKMMDCRGFWVLLYVFLGSCMGSDKGATWLFGVGTGTSPLPLLKLSCLRRDSKNRPPWQLFMASDCYATVNDGLQMFLSAIVCLIGSWVGSDKGATWLFVLGTSLMPHLKHSEMRRGSKN